MNRLALAMMMAFLFLCLGCDGAPQPIKNTLPSSKEGPKGIKGKTSSVSDSTDDLPKAK